MRACTFIGHRDFSIKNYGKLCLEIKKLIVEENVRTFYVGTQGYFDRMVYEALCEFEKCYNIEIIVVLAYLNMSKEVYFDMNKTLFPEVLEKTPMKYVISVRNKYMIENSQYMICGIDNTFSNSYSFVDYAIKKKLTIINIGSYKI